MQAEVIDDAAPTFAKHTFSMRVVYHEENVIFLSNFYQIRKGSDVAVHTEDTICNDQGAAEVGGVLFDRVFQCTWVIMFIRYDLRAGETASVNDRGMVQSIRKDHIFFAEQS